MISIIVPVYKVEPYLHQCLDSILNQTYRDFELLLIDDGSPDKCGEICEEYSNIDSRIRVFHKKNGGLSASRNFGIREAKGEYIGFVDSDDWIEPNMYEILLQRLEECSADVSACGIRREYAKKKIDCNIQKGILSGREAIRVLVYESSTVWNMLFRKKCWAGVQFPDGRLYEDLATTYKVFIHARLVSYTPEVLYHYRMRGDSIVHSRTMNNLIDYWEAVNNRHLFLCNFPSTGKDQDILNKTEEEVAYATTRIWRLVHGIPRNERDYVFLRKVTCYVRKNFPLFGRKNWKKHLRIIIFFSRYVNDVSFAVLYALNSFLKTVSHTAL